MDGRNFLFEASWPTKYVAIPLRRNFDSKLES